MKKYIIMLGIRWFLQTKRRMCGIAGSGIIPLYVTETCRGGDKAHLTDEGWSLNKREDDTRQTE
jgi:hypothetical protein